MTNERMAELADARDRLERLRLRLTRDGEWREAWNVGDVVHDVDLMITEWRQRRAA